MNPPSNQVDQHGFPVPKKFDDELPPGAGRRSPTGKSRSFRLLIAVLFVAVAVAALVESPIGSVVRSMWVSYLAERGVEKFQADDVPGALADFDQAVAWMSAETDPRVAAAVYLRRAQIRLDAKQVTPAREDADRAIELAPKESYSYLVRSLIWQRLNDHQAALKDIDEAVKYRSARDPNVFNTRAYARALAGIELDEALDDVNKAISFWPGDNAAFLDTRGYVHYLQGRQEPALVDFNRAIQLAEQDREREISQLTANKNLTKRVIERVKRQHDHALAVMYHHRGEVYQKLGRAAEAKVDLSRGDQLGYNPAEGVF